jgi:transcriptional regulator with XRE-family HTH domain
MPIFREPIRVPRSAEIKKMLLDRNMSVTDLADAVGYGRQYMSAIICGRAGTIPSRQKIADYLGVALDDIFPITEPGASQGKQHRAA